MNPVRVDIQNTKRFTRLAYENMNGKAGVIVLWHEKDQGICLVRFDTPAQPFYGNGRPVNEFWFHTTDLVDLGGNI